MVCNYVAARTHAMSLIATGLWCSVLSVVCLSQSVRGKAASCVVLGCCIHMFLLIVILDLCRPLQSRALREAQGAVALSTTSR